MVKLDAIWRPAVRALVTMTSQKSANVFRCDLSLISVLPLDATFGSLEELDLVAQIVITRRCLLGDSAHVAPTTVLAVAEQPMSEWLCGGAQTVLAF